MDTGGEDNPSDERSNEGKLSEPPPSRMQRKLGKGRHVRLVGEEETDEINEQLELAGTQLHNRSK